MKNGISILSKLDYPKKKKKTKKKKKKKNGFRLVKNKRKSNKRMVSDYVFVKDYIAYNKGFNLFRHYSSLHRKFW